MIIKGLIMVILRS